MFLLLGESKTRQLEFQIKMMEIEHRFFGLIELDQDHEVYKLLNFYTVEIKSKYISLQLHLYDLNLQQFE